MFGSVCSCYSCRVGWLWYKLVWELGIDGEGNLIGGLWFRGLEIICVWLWIECVVDIEVLVVFFNCLF